MTPDPLHFQHDIDRVAEALSDYRTQLGVNPDERPEHGGDTTAQTLASGTLWRTRSRLWCRAAVWMVAWIGRGMGV